MSKDSYWFRHDDNAGRGLKMRKMSHVYGHWGKGIYWDVVEILRSQDKYMFSSDESSLSLLSDLIGCKDESKFINWFNDCIRIGLFEIVDKSFFLCPPLTENMKVWEAKKDNGSKGGRPKKKTETKPKQNLNESESKANQKHNIIEDKIIEDKIIEDNKEKNTHEQKLNWFKQQVKETKIFNSGKYPDKMFIHFTEYWTAKKPNGTKMAYEMQKTFSFQARLMTWVNNDNEYKKL